MLLSCHCQCAICWPSLELQRITYPDRGQMTTPRKIADISMYKLNAQWQGWWMLSKWSELGLWNTAASSKPWGWFKDSKLRMLGPSFSKRLSFGNFLWLCYHWHPISKSKISHQWQYNQRKYQKGGHSERSLVGTEGHEMANYEVYRDALKGEPQVQWIWGEKVALSSLQQARERSFSSSYSGNLGSTF